MHHRHLRLFFLCVLLLCLAVACTKRPSARRAATESRNPVVAEDTSMPRADPAYLQYLERNSMLAKASEAALLELFLASVKGDAALAGQTGRPQLEAVVQDLAEKGFVVREKGNLSATADWNGKALTVNGKPLFQMKGTFDHRAPQRLSLLFA